MAQDDFPGPIAAGLAVTYRSGGCRSRLPCRRGVVAGGAVFDRYTDITWVPVRGDGRALDTEPEWVRAENIIEVSAGA
ncbi:hypothetical protein [Amycolatopsis sp. PS_44_ISF1]|uniref:hypothetical protein n=1 Tax=Amycolatopsis sp. PS_44_ISF1 TaxID=2974917 RepID=UPI0028DF2EB6|nr:hypothetical protein [Amycolatopsis sp. PS_44_ISF1]MDT8912900.1 hypothetical protein [Amycolatopsis sp. PS_44_ISF1]